MGKVTRRTALGVIAAAAGAAIVGRPGEPVAAHELTFDQLAARYAHLKVSDAHNHAAIYGVEGKIATWERARLARIAIFGDVSRPGAAGQDLVSWRWYQRDPEFFVPYVAGLDLRDDASVEVAREKLELGYFGLGELAAAATYAQGADTFTWKAQHPMDGALPGLYRLCAEYNAPILLHIDPPAGLPLEKLHEACDAFPDTRFVFAHINAYTSPDLVAALLELHPNLYADFFAAFTERNVDSQFRLADYVPVAVQFADRFMISSDSGFAVGGERRGIESMLRFLEVVDDEEVARKVAHDTFNGLIMDQQPTATQLAALADTASGYRPLTKWEAGRLLARTGVLA